MDINMLKSFFLFLTFLLTFRLPRLPVLQFPDRIASQSDWRSCCGTRWALTWPPHLIDFIDFRWNSIVRIHIFCQFTDYDGFTVWIGSPFLWLIDIRYSSVRMIAHIVVHHCGYLTLCVFNTPALFYVISHFTRSTPEIGSTRQKALLTISNSNYLWLLRLRL